MFKVSRAYTSKVLIPFFASLHLPVPGSSARHGCSGGLDFGAQRLRGSCWRPVLVMQWPRWLGGWGRSGRSGVGSVDKVDNVEHATSRDTCRVLSWISVKTVEDVLFNFKINHVPSSAREIFGMMDIGMMDTEI